MKLRDHNGKMYLRDFCIEDIAEEFETPFFLYDLDVIKQKIQTFRNTFGDTAELYYAIKANPNLEILKAIRGDLDGLDISSDGELKQALLADYEPDQLSYAGPGKTKQELKNAINAGVGIISVESVRELEDIKNIALAHGKPANIAMRINPKLLIKEFAIKMGGKASQFGIDEENIGMAVDFIKQAPNAFNFRGIHIYAGTQCMNEDALSKNISNTLEIAWKLKRDHGVECNWINFGGGFGVSYYEEGVDIDLEKIAVSIKEPIENYKASVKVSPRFVVELGRYIVSESGIYVTRVISEKKSRGEYFFVLDGGMNHHLAASGNLGAILRKNYIIKNLSNTKATQMICHLVGPLCTPMDLMGKKVLVAMPSIGNLIGFLNSGSYAYTASPLFFLGHETAVELLLANKDVRVIRNRKTLIDLN